MKPTGSGVEYGSELKLIAIVLLTAQLAVGRSFGGVPSPSPPSSPTAAGTPVMIGTPVGYLAQAVCPDGSPPSDCDNPTTETVSTLLKWRKRDWPGYGSGEMSDSVTEAGNPSIVISPFSTSPFRAFTPPNDGGDVYGLDGGSGTAVALKTRDGSLSADLYFVGLNCGGTGWLLFPTTLAAGAWNFTLAKVGQSSSPAACAPLSFAYTRYRLETVQVEFIMLGTRTKLAVPTIISEHFDGSDPTTAKMLERFYFGLNWGKYRWERWDSPGIAPRRGLAEECPGMSPWSSAPPFPGATMTDCRMWTNIVWQPGTFDIDMYGWTYP
jgi:hypothetical protein